MCDEYARRYGRVHKCRAIIEWCRDNEPKIPDGGLTAFRQAVAEDCYDEDPVVAYHRYYRKYKAYFAKWKLGNVPVWFAEVK